MTKPVEDDAKTAASKAAKALGKAGGKARAAVLTKEQRSEIAKKAAEERWKKWRENR